MSREWFDGTHLVRRVGNTSRLETAMADSQGNRTSEFEPLKGREVWGECIGFVRRCEGGMYKGKVSDDPTAPTSLSVHTHDLDDNGRCLACGEYVR